MGDASYKVQSEVNHGCSETDKTYNKMVGLFYDQSSYDLNASGIEMKEPYNKQLWKEIYIDIDVIRKYGLSNKVTQS